MIGSSAQPVHSAASVAAPVPSFKRGRQVRTFSISMIARKLISLRDAGVDIDAIPLTWTVEQLMQATPERALEAIALCGCR